MVRAVWYDDPGRAGQLLLVIHHLVIDGVSWRILTDDLARAWAEVAAGSGAAALDDVPTSFRTWSNAIAAARFDAEADVLEPTCWPPPTPISGARPLDPAVDTADTVRSQSFSLPADVSSALLSSVPAAIHGGVNDVLLTALALALAQWRADRGHGGDGTAARAEPGGPRPRGGPGARATSTCPAPSAGSPPSTRSRIDPGAARLGRRAGGRSSAGGRGEVGQGTAARRPEPRPRLRRAAPPRRRRHPSAAPRRRSCSTTSAGSPAAAAGTGNRSPRSARCAKASTPPIPPWHWRSTPSPRTGPTAPR